MKAKIDNVTITPGMQKEWRSTRDKANKIILAGQRYEPGTDDMMDAILDMQAQAIGGKDFAQTDDYVG
jgi:hypothetical protein